MTDRLSVVVPVYRNEATLVELRDRLTATLEAIPESDFELIFVHDASPDRSWPVIEELAAADPRVVGLALESNVGQVRAVCAGLARAGGDAIVSIDADLEHPPEAIPRLLEAWREGHDFVAVTRTGRVPESIRDLGSRAVNRFARALGVPVADVGCSFFLCAPQVELEIQRLVVETGRRMVLPTVYRGARNPTIVEVELTTNTRSAYALKQVLGLGVEFLVAELVPTIARRLLVASACSLLLGIHPRLRKRLLAWGAALAVLGLAGLDAPSTYRRDASEPLYEVAAQVGQGLGVPTQGAGGGGFGAASGHRLDADRWSIEARRGRSPRALDRFPD